MKCGAFSKSFIIYFWNYGCLLYIFSMFSWWALPQFLSLAYHEDRWFWTQKKIHQTFGELVFLSSDHWNELAGNTRSRDSRVILNDRRKEKSTGKLKLKLWVWLCMLFYAIIFARTELLCFIWSWLVSFLVSCFYLSSTRDINRLRAR